MLPFLTRMLEFGEHCKHKLQLHKVQIEGTMAARWNRGIFLGICRMTGRYLIWDDGVATAARTIIRLPDVQKWDKEKVAAVTSRPWQLHERKEPAVQFREPTDGPAPDRGPEQTRETRRLYIKRADV